MPPRAAREILPALNPPASGAYRTRKRVDALESLLDVPARSAVLALAVDHERRGEIDASLFLAGVVDVAMRPFAKVPRVVFSIPPMTLHFGDATRLGLALAEFTCNAVRHAWSDPQVGTLRIALARSGASLDLMVHDDGVGFDGSGRGRTGLAFVRALEGVLTISGAGGTTARFTLTKGA